MQSILTHLYIYYITIVYSFYYCVLNTIFPSFFSFCLFLGNNNTITTNTMNYSSYRRGNKRATTGNNSNNSSSSYLTNNTHNNNYNESNHSNNHSNNPNNTTTDIYAQPGISSSGAEPHCYASNTTTTATTTSTTNTSNNNVTYSGDYEKEHKIRIVDRLGTIRVALRQDECIHTNTTRVVPGQDECIHDNFTPNNTGNSSNDNNTSQHVPPMVSTFVTTNTSNSNSNSNSTQPSPTYTTTTTDQSPFPFGNHNTTTTATNITTATTNIGGTALSVPTDPLKWLDDQELSLLSTEQLEVLMDRYIMAVVKQLVQLAAVDEDLRTEIDALDNNGFSLLHYCCLYNLTSLIPVLIARGCDVNKRTSTGSTSLHLAASAGNSAVVTLLVECGAVVDNCDANNILPSDAAYEAGFIDIYNFLIAVRYII